MANLESFVKFKTFFFCSLLYVIWRRMILDTLREDILDANRYSVNYLKLHFVVAVTKNWRFCVFVVETMKVFFLSGLQANSWKIWCHFRLWYCEKVIPFHLMICMCYECTGGMFLLIWPSYSYVFTEECFCIFINEYVLLWVRFVYYSFNCWRRIQIEYLCHY